MMLYIAQQNLLSLKLKLNQLCATLQAGIVVSHLTQPTYV
jgi:hypothetical protein